MATLTDSTSTDFSTSPSPSSTSVAGVRTTTSADPTATTTITATLAFANGYAGAYVNPIYPGTYYTCDITLILTCTASALCSTRPTITYNSYRRSGTPYIATTYSSRGTTTLKPSQGASSVYYSASARCFQNGADQSWTCNQYTWMATYNAALLAASSSSTSTTISTTKTFATNEMGYAYVDVTPPSVSRFLFGSPTAPTMTPSNLAQCLQTVASVPPPTPNSATSDNGKNSTGIALGVCIPLGLLIVGVLIWKIVAGRRKRRARRSRAVAMDDLGADENRNRETGMATLAMIRVEDRERREQGQIPPPAYQP